MELRNLDALAHSVAIDSMVIDAPDVDMRCLANGTLELERFLSSADAAAGPAPDKAGSDWTFSITDARVSNGTLRLLDSAAAPEFRATLSNVAIHGQRIASSGSPGSVEVAFDSDEGAHFTGRADVDVAQKVARGHFEFAKFHLAKLYPYYADALNVEVR